MRNIPGDHELANQIVSLIAEISVEHQVIVFLNSRGAVRDFDTLKGVSRETLSTTRRNMLRRGTLSAIVFVNVTKYDAFLACHLVEIYHEDTPEPELYACTSWRLLPEQKQVFQWIHVPKGARQVWMEIASPITGREVDE